MVTTAATAVTKASKDKVVSCKGDEAEEMILSYMRAQNRPYGAMDISANLKSRVSKLQAQKTLTTLAEREEIVGKAYGKTIIYCYPQKEADTISCDELKLLQADISLLKEAEAGLRQQVGLLRTQRADLTQELTTPELPSTMQHLLHESSLLSTTIKALLTTNSAPLMTTAEIAAIKEKYSFLMKMDGARGKVVKEIEGMLMEQAGAKKGMEAEVWYNVGWEDDA